MLTEFREKDRVRVLVGDDDLKSGTVASVDGRLIRIHDIGDPTPFPIEVVELSCYRSECDQPAAGYAANGDPICEGHASETHTHLIGRRPAARPIVLACRCGFDLAERGNPEGVWTIGDVACEYRTCVECSSTRAFAPLDVVKGRRVELYLDPETSELSGSWESFLDALEESEIGEHGELRRNGVILAKAFRALDGELRWRVSRPELEVPCAV